MEEVVCGSSKRNIANDRGSVQFKCPNCGKTNIVRGTHARQIVSKYICHECGFEGP